MHMASPRTLPDNVTIEYDSRGKRVRKTFASAFEARKFWKVKDQDGKNPKVISDKPAPPKPQSEQIKAVAYYRMSSDKKEASIDDQRTAVEKFAASNGYEIARQY